MIFGAVFDLESVNSQLQSIEQELASPEVWQDQDKVKQLAQSKAPLELIINQTRALSKSIEDLKFAFELAGEEQDERYFADCVTEFKKLQKELNKFELTQIFSGDSDVNDAYLDIQAGSGGTEAQDWANMLLRMYLRWAEKEGFRAEIVARSEGDVAGIKSATIKLEGAYAFGWLRTETGVHRLVRKSPFDSGNRRHTSFAAVFASPVISDDVEIDMNPSDLRIDTYRASGAGGQHVNTTDSAVRITHVPTGIVVQCQNDRSQHKNKEQAMKQLRSRLYQQEMQNRLATQKEMEANKSDISWGSQIRSYVLDASRIKDLRTGVEKSNTQAVLDGDLNDFIEASLRGKKDE